MIPFILDNFVICINFKTYLRRWKAIFINFVDSYTLTLIPQIDDFLRLLTFTSAVILHDAIYQFLRIFYYSRFKPPSLRNDFDITSWLIGNCNLSVCQGQTIMKNYKKVSRQLNLLCPSSKLFWSLVQFWQLLPSSSKSFRQKD